MDAPFTMNTPVYMGFWRRVLASLLDNLLLFLLSFIVFASYHYTGHISSEGQQFWYTVFNWLIVPALIIACWITWQGTPGKLILRGQICDALTLAPPSKCQLLIRYLGYIIAILPLGAGILWIAYDDRKQGWHDKLARTVVIVKPKPHTERYLL